MTSLNEILTRGSGDAFLGVVELEYTSIVGILDEPMGIELGNVRLGYPIEFVQKWESPDVRFGIIVPEAGIPEEMVVDAGTVAIYMGTSIFGTWYFNNIKQLAMIRPREFRVDQISRTQAMKGAANGLRERPTDGLQLRAHSGYDGAADTNDQRAATGQAEHDSGSNPDPTCPPRLRFYRNAGKR